jgi:hypothetical protein
MQVLSTPQGAIQVPSNQQILCEFQQGGLSPWEIELGLKSFHFAGQPDENVVPKENRLSVFDTETWQMQVGADDTTREFVERRLLQDVMYGQDYIACDEKRHPAPWPNYDQVGDVPTLFEMLDLLGYNNRAEDIEMVRMYEHQNQKRPEFLQALNERQVELSPVEPAGRREEVVTA